MSDDELIIDDDYFEPEDIEDSIDVFKQPDYSALNTFAKFIDQNLHGFKYNISGGTISINIPTAVLPITQSIVYGYNVNELLLEFTIEFKSTPDYTKKPECTCSNPVHGTNFIGKSLVEEAISQFFSTKYVKDKKHPSAPILFRLGKSPKDDVVAKLVAEGFNLETAINVLTNTNDINTARNFLLTGRASSLHYNIPIPYDHCPLMYLLVDVVDAFYKLSYCCCICGKELPQPCIKPTPCTNKMCMFQATKIGLGNSIIQEIKRDPLAADFVLSAFANCLGTKFMNPAPTPDIIRIAPDVLSKLPSMQELALTCATDADLNKKCGQEAQDVLRYVLFTNRNQFISLPSNMRIQEIPSTSFQFLTLTADPNKETVFQDLKKRYGSRLLWHGSHYDRWYPIFHNGLVDASGANSNLQANGKALGPGIYFGPNADTSWGYVRPAPRNVYKNSSFPHFSCIALCEVANVPELKDHGRAFTLTNESACIVRYLIVGKQFDLTISSHNIPTYDLVLSEIAKRK